MFVAIEAEVMRRVAELMGNGAPKKKGVGERTMSDEEARLLGQRLDEEERQQRLAKMKFTCCICQDEQSINGSYEIPVCEHRFCLECVSGWVESKISTREVSIRCPFTGCDSQIPLPLIGEVASRESWLKYQTFATEDAIDSQIRVIFIENHNVKYT